jgi:2-keto-3-deoxy-L-rhamnonate aldolase RhmA
MGQINDPEVTAAIDRVLSHCRNAGLPVGYFGVTAEAVREHSAKGCSMLVSGVDVVFLGSSAKKMFKEMQ